MGYRILIQEIVNQVLIRGVVNTNQAILRWYVETYRTPWETESEDIALVKYKELLQKYSAGDLTLVTPFDVDITVSA
jgi:hypothetical protein